MVVKVCCVCGGEFNVRGNSLRCVPCRAIPDPRCKRCKKVKPLREFPRDASRPSGMFPWCLKCQAEAVSSKAFQDPDDPPNGWVCPVDDTPIRGHANRRYCSNTCKDRAASLKDKYNLEVAQFRDMVVAANGTCPICLKRPTQWHVDHDHKTGQVHGVVCSMCNVRPIAYTYHNIQLVQRLLDYLKSPPALGLGINVIANVGRQASLDHVWARATSKGSVKRG